MLSMSNIIWGCVLVQSTAETNSGLDRESGVAQETT